MSNHPENLASVSIGTKSPSPSLSDNYTRGLDAFKGLWDEALANHKSQLGHDLFDSDFAREIQVAVTDQDVTAVVEKQEHLFKKYRERGGRIKSSLKQLVRLLIPFSGAVGDTTTVFLPGAKVIVVAVTGLLEASTKVSSLYDEMENILEKIKGTFGRFQTYLQPQTPITPQLSKILLESLEAIINILALIAKYSESAIQMQKTRSFWKPIQSRSRDYVGVLLGHTDVQELFKKLEKLTNAQLLQTACETHANIRDTQADVGRIKQFVDVWASQEERNDIHRWIGPADVDALHNIVRQLRERQINTCEWIFEDEEFNNWKARNNGVYCIFGTPGSGKSALCSIIIERLKEEVETEGSFILAYFYFSSTASHSDALSSLRALMTSLIFQIASSSPRCWDVLRQERAKPAGLKHPTHEKLFEILRNLLCVSGPTFIVIDALDECQSRDPLEPDQQSFLLEFLVDLYHLRLPGLRLLVTTRPEIKIREYLTDYEPAQSSLILHEKKEHSEDLERYISARLSNRRLFRWKPEVLEKAKLLLNAKAHGMFLWVNLQLRHLEQCQPHLIDRLLDKLPEGLPGTYTEILRRFSPGGTSEDRVRSVLQCIAFARRPLTVNEVVDVLLFDNEAQSFAVGEEIDDPEDYVRRHLPGLVDIVHSENQMQVVHFIHLSVKEYLIRDDRPAGFYSFNQHCADITVTTLCLASLRPNASAHFRNYAAEYWHEHVSHNGGNDFDVTGRSDDAEGGIAAERLNTALEDFLEPNSPAFEAFDNAKSTPLHWAARLGLPHHTKRLLNQYDVDVLDSEQNTPLFSAAANTKSEGHFLTMDLLLEKGANIEIQPKPARWSILHRAIHAPWSVEVVHYLVRKGAIVDATKIGGDTPLHEAAWWGKAPTVTALVQHGANKHALANGSQTPLHRCCWCDRHDVARALLNLRVDPEYAEVNGCTPLHYAAAFGFHTTLDVLLEKGADAYARTSSTTTLGANSGPILIPEGATALHVAAQKPAITVCETLLRHDGGLINAIDALGRTPLHYAARQRHHQTVSLLLRHGADPCALDNSGSTPLELARKPPQPEKIQIRIPAELAGIFAQLLRRNAVAGDLDNSGSTPLTIAAVNVVPQPQVEYEPSQLEVIRVFEEHALNSLVLT